MKEPRGPAELIRRWVQASDMRSMAEWRRFVRGAGLSMPQLSLLMRLYHGGGCSVHDLGKGLGVSSAAASQMVDRLVQAQLVDRVESPEDRRVRTVALSAQGRHLIDRRIRSRYRWVDELVGELGADTKASMGKVLHALIEAEKRLPGAIPGGAERR
jgi:DNA-binding MarR family transcriptional regulator